MRFLQIVRVHKFSGLLLACVSFGAQATEVALAGVFPGKALVIINNGAPRALAVGASTPEGVRIVAVDDAGATVEVDGKRRRLVVGEHAVSVGATGVASESIVLQGDSRGHFHAQGAVNGVAIRFLVDTGATSVALGRSDALKAGVAYTRGEPRVMETANGQARGWLVSLDSVRINGITLRNVPGVVLEVDMPQALLGMSFLNRMDMRREGGALYLRQRY
ncbi:TIGR02281 family clan AA aspartic protease [Zoogloea sp. G-4-1-14]|uniref:TIGR02281 family clan AA aspartic protease n=1 Tax=Zoogloea dura TaxID=2728840 RepID=A0A848FZD4_9RHOO|nr:TIGR02281 family clan AA aspartic protease [Zoogloea dura]